MTVSLPNTLSAIIDKARKITARPSASQISDQQIIQYINTYYVYDMPEELRMESLRVNYQFLTNANTPAYDLPTSIFLDVMPPVYIAGYQSYMTQSRENFFRINPELNFFQQGTAVYTGGGAYNPNGSFQIQCTETPILRSFKQNPPGAFSATTVLASTINWNILISGVDANGNNQTLIDDGQGHLYRLTDRTTVANLRGTLNYTTGLVNIFAGGFALGIPDLTTINIQYIPYVASRPQSCVFFQDQILLYPIPDQAYTVSFEAYQYPVSFTINPDGSFDANAIPQVLEWWQMIAVGAAMKIFEDAADFEMMAKYAPVLNRYERLALRRTIVQQTSERVATIYTEQTIFPQFPFGNLFTGF